MFSFVQEKVFGGFPTENKRIIPFSKTLRDDSRRTQSLLVDSDSDNAGAVLGLALQKANNG